MDLQKIEEKWQKNWAKAKLGEARLDEKPKFFMIFAYPGISGFLHVGHMRGFSYTDAICRYKRMRGFNVLFPVGTHASGNQAIAFANKVKNKDLAWIEYLKRNGCPDKVIAKLTSKDKVIEYFNEVYVEQYWKKFGFLCDWDRFTCTSYPDYEKFIQWQFKKLRDADLLVQKPYYATFCPEDGPVAVDPSETDISKGGGAERQEYTLLKFPLDNAFLVAATLRPETVFGQTNLWINPTATYVKAKVGKETWVLSEAAAEKLGYQKDGVVVGEEISAKDLIGRNVKAPMSGKMVPILPAAFVDPGIGTGLVTSVPSDAPYDYVALKTLQENIELCKSYRLDPAKIKAISLVAIIKTQGFGDLPGKEASEKRKIIALDEKEKLDEATQEVYKAGFHSGVLGSACGKYAGMKVAQAKEKIREDLMAKGEADIFYDLSEEVVCRCGAQVVVKRIDDQWFIKYSDNALTQKSKAHSQSMSIHPEDFKKNLPSILDWFSDRACTRLGNWIGSRLPFDDKWIVEPISDSTLYPLYYLISRYVNEKQINLEDLTEPFFDFVFLGKGDIKLLANKIHVEQSLLEQIRRDVQYYYPLDINLGGKEHQTVHFPVFIMNHVGLLPEKMWPRGIFVNFWVTGKGSKISKSKGGAEPIPGAIERYSVDGMRLYYSHIGSADSDIVWDPEAVSSYKQAVERSLDLATELVKGKEKKSEHIDKWLKSQSQHHIHEATQAFEKLDIRAAASVIFFGIYDDLRWYQRRGGQNTGMLKEIVADWAKLMMPITPHIAEEIYSKIHKDELVSASKWPTHDEKQVDLAAQQNEKMISDVVDDIRTVVKLAKMEKANEVTLVVSSAWKYPLYAELKKLLGATRNVGEIIKKLMADTSFKENAKDIAPIVNGCLKDPTKVPLLVTDQQSEHHSLESALKFLEAEIGAKFHLVKAEKSTESKAGSARPGKPAIVVK